MELINISDVSKRYKNGVTAIYDLDLKIKKDENNSLTSIIYGGRSDLKFTDAFLKVYPQSVDDRIKAISKEHDNVKELSPNEEYVASICRGELISSFKLKLPVIVRSVSLDDEIKSADGKMKKVSDILNDWKLSDLDRSLLPVFQVLESSEQSIIALAGSFLGYKDWIVKL